MKRIFPERPIVAVGALILKNNKILLVKRKNHPDKGKWSIPGGAVRVGESLKEAIAREVKEECGIDVGEGKIAAIIDKIYFTTEGKVIFHYSIVDFLFEDFSGKPHAGSDAESVELFPINNVPKCSNVAISVKELLKNLKENEMPVYTVYKEKYNEK